MLIIVCGLPGSGKTTLARALARNLGGVHVSSDLTRKRLFPKPAYSEDEKARVYGEMASECEKALREGRDVIVDATFHKKAVRERFLAMDAKVFTILCILPEGNVEERLARRKRGGPSDADFGVYLKMRGEWERLETPHLALDTSTPLRRQVAEAMAHIGR
ncbi:MAG: AAA family ATPase [Candidatus Micrarchaeota archaeon]